MLEGDSGSNFFKINLLVLGLYMFLSLIISLLLNISSFRSWSAKSDQFRFVESLKWLYQVNSDTFYDETPKLVDPLIKTPFFHRIAILLDAGCLRNLRIISGIVLK